MKNNNFVLDNYINLIKNITKILCVMDYRKYKTGLILRHDIDFSLDLAYEFSRIEKKNSILSTYYVLLTSDLYNPFSFESKKKLKTMIDDGFEIGLHFDPAAYGNISEMELNLKFFDEIKIFESMLNFKIYSYSLHNPSIYGKVLNFNNYINAYNDEIFNDDCYISDSVYSFKGKVPSEFINKSKFQLIQFLTHPAQYFSEGNESYEKQMNVIMNKYLEKFDKTFIVNKLYSEQRGKYNLKLKL